MFRRTCFAVVAAVLAASTLAGCQSGGGSSEISAPAVVTFEVAGSERYSIELDTDELVQHVVELQNGGEEGRIPNGEIVRDGDGDVNSPWTWHIDPATLEFADATTGVCDGLPSAVEDGSLTSDNYCPWDAKVVELKPLG
ncbi:hypothetical protein [Compostimonas suwonensis]|uniref:BP74 N-terminal domain-containing protein n=1 Tax=Compostimonas suwonensis TaxID=1048394 RepID=A0A2M9BVT2_9MICO|nr:hypothetical protein [Compostimonas suwonensis]PJJ62035.1 hypothetical protein CLV54_1827 [Compostimonas suwonensis]